MIFATEDYRLSGIRFMGILKGKKKLFKKYPIAKITKDFNIGDSYMIGEPTDVMYLYKGEWQTIHAEMGDRIVCVLDNDLYSPKKTYILIENIKEYKKEEAIWLDIN